MKNDSEKMSPVPSRVLSKLRAGRNAYCMKFNFDSARAIEIAGLTGFDCAWCCQEHIATDLSLMERYVLAAKAYGIDLLMRVPRGSYSDLVRPLEVDASGIMVPHVMSAADARNIVRQTRFHPVGLRALDGGNADGQYCMLSIREYFEFVNNNRFLLLQIEDVEAMEELEEICAVPGIDIIFFGPGDYSQSIGFPGELNHPQVVAARKRVAECALRHGKFAGTVGSTDNVAELHKMGYSFVNLGADVVGFGNYCRDIQQKLRDAGLK
jgi:4-hydroxy-2-oxoheptanedioate aldolase